MYHHFHFQAVPSFVNVSFQNVMRPTIRVMFCFFNSIRAGFINHSHKFIASYIYKKGMCNHLPYKILLIMPLFSTMYQQMNVQEASK